MQDKQEKIYYLTAESYAAAKNSPHLELFRKKGIEVLLMYDRVDEWMMSFMDEYKGKKFVSVAKGALDLGELEDQQEKQKAEQAEKDFQPLVERMQKVLEDRVKEVKVSHRLTDSPSCLVVAENDMAVSMQKLLKQAGHNVPTIEPVLEINPDHVLVRQLQGIDDEQHFNDWTLILFEQAMLSEGGQLDDPVAYVSRVNKMLQQLTS
jgi:molecular chaperone HtpG